MLLEKFLKTIKAKNRRKNTLDLINHSVTKAELWLGTPLEDVDADEILSYIEHIKVHGFIHVKKDGTIDDTVEGRPLGDSSIWTVESKLLQFYKFCFDETDDPKFNKMVKKIKGIMIDKPKNNIGPQDILWPDEIKKLINVATIERDRCLVSVLYEGGLRLGELLALTLNMVELVDEDRKQEVTFHIPNIEGCKTGARSVLCLEVFGYVQDWLKCNTSTRFMPLSENGVSSALDRLFEKANIKKPNNAHNLRHSSITNAVIMKMQPNEISMRYWGIPNSNMLSVYIHLSQQIVNSGYRDAKGMGNGNVATVINPLALRCVECGRLVQAGSLCKQCFDIKNLRAENRKIAEMYNSTAQANGFLDAEISEMQSAMGNHDTEIDELKKTIKAQQDYMEKMILKFQKEILKTETEEVF